MQLLIKREQKDAWTPNFILWAKFELSEAEQQLLGKFKVDKVVFSEGDKRRDIIKATLYALGVAVIATIGLTYLHIPNAMLLCLIAIPIVAYLIYQQIREEVRITDMLNGRDFECRSVLTLMEKEMIITQWARIFREFLEAMENWGGQQIVEIEPGMKPNIHILDHPHAAA